MTSKSYINKYEKYKEKYIKLVKLLAGSKSEEEDWNLQVYNPTINRNMAPIKYMKRLDDMAVHVTFILNIDFTEEVAELFDVTSFPVGLLNEFISSANNQQPLARFIHLQYYPFLNKYGLNYVLTETKTKNEVVFISLKPNFKK